VSTVAVVSVPGGTAKLGIYSRDHCPPHATFRDQANTWVVRIAFSFLDSTISLLSILPFNNAPSAQVINTLAQALTEENLSECRRLWWMFQRDNPSNRTAGPCCLNGQLFGSSVILNATYDPTARRTRLEFVDGSVIDVAP
jgi:hypothetical protein